MEVEGTGLEVVVGPREGGPEEGVVGPVVRVSLGRWGSEVRVGWGDDDNQIPDFFGETFLQN